MAVPFLRYGHLLYLASGSNLAAAEYPDFLALRRQFFFCNFTDSKRFQLIIVRI